MELTLPEDSFTVTPRLLCPHDIPSAVKWRDNMSSGEASVIVRDWTDPGITTTLQAWLLPWQPFRLPNKGSHHSSTDYGILLSRLPVSSQFILTGVWWVSCDYLRSAECEEWQPSSTPSNISDPKSKHWAFSWVSSPNVVPVCASKVSWVNSDAWGKLL